MPLGKSFRPVNAGKPGKVDALTLLASALLSCYGPRMIDRPAAPLLAAVLALLCTGCANGESSRYPSLAIRDVERVKGSAQPVTPDPGPAPPLAPSADLAGRLAQLDQQAQTANLAFLGAVSRTEAMVEAAAGSAVASENWSVATAALSQLDALRNPAALALADLDRLYVDSEMELGAVEAISAVRDGVQAQVQAQEATLDRIASRMPQ